jgi:hypothetical protein
MENRASFFRPYKSMYVDMKLPQIAEIRRERYDKARSEYDQLQRAVGSIRLLNDEEESVKNKLLADVDSMMAGGVDFENMGRVISDATTRFMTDTKLMDAMDSKATADKEKQVADKIRMEKGDNAWLDFGKQYERDATGNILYDPATKAPVQNDIRKSWNTEKLGIYSPKGEAKLDWDTKMLTWLQGINEDPILLQRGRAMGIDIPYILASGTQVSQDKLDLVADFLAESFANETPEGQQMMRNYMQLQLDPSTGGKNTYSQNAAKEEIKKHLLSLGAKQVGGKLQYMFDQYGIKMAEAAAAQQGPIRPLSIMNINEHPSFAGFDVSEIDGIDMSNIDSGEEYKRQYYDPIYRKTITDSKKFMSNEVFKEEVDKLGGFGSNSAVEYLDTRRPQMYRYMLTSDEFAQDRKDLEAVGIKDKKEQLKAMTRAMRSLAERKESPVQPGSRETINGLVSRAIQNPASTLKMVTGGMSDKVNLEELQKTAAGNFGQDALMEQLLESLGTDGTASVGLEVQGPDAGYFVYNGYLKEAQSGIAGGGGNLKDGVLKFKIKAVEEQDYGFSIVRSVYNMLDSKSTKADFKVTENTRKFLSDATGMDLSGSEIEVRRKLSVNGDQATYVPELVVGGKPIARGMDWVESLSSRAVQIFDASHGGNVLGTIFAAQKDKNDNRFE